MPPISLNVFLLRFISFFKSLSLGKKSKTIASSAPSLEMQQAAERAFSRQTSHTVGGGGPRAAEKPRKEVYSASSYAALDFGRHSPPLLHESSASSLQLVAASSSAASAAGRSRAMLGDADMARRWQGGSHVDGLAEHSTTFPLRPIALRRTLTEEMEERESAFDDVFAEPAPSSLSRKHSHDRSLHHSGVHQSYV